MKPLSDDLEELLDAERDIDVPAPAQRQRLFARLEPLLLLPAAVGAATAGTAASSAASATAEATASAIVTGAFRAKLVASLVSAAMIGGVVGAAGHAYYVSHRPASVAPTAPADSMPKSVPATPTAPAPPAEPESSARTAPAPSAAPAPEPASSAPRAEERARGAGSLRAERLLIETASAALMRGDNASAIQALRQHARTFPKGDLAEEREVLLVKALAASGEDAAARKRAKDFKKKFPGSMQQGSVDKAARPE